MKVLNLFYATPNKDAIQFEFSIFLGASTWIFHCWPLLVVSDFLHQNKWLKYDYEEAPMSYRVYSRHVTEMHYGFIIAKTTAIRKMELDLPTHAGMYP